MSGVHSPYVDGGNNVYLKYRVDLQPLAHTNRYPRHIDFSAQPEIMKLFERLALAFAAAPTASVIGPGPVGPVGPGGGGSSNPGGPCAAACVSIGAQVRSLDSLIKAYTGGNGAAIFSGASKVLSACNNGSKVCAAASPITDLGAALTILTYCTPLASSVKTLATDIISAKSRASKNGIQASIESIVIRERSCILSLITVFTNKAQGGASAARPILQTSFVNPITSAENSIVSAYA